ncbi:DEAD/DEAH box helicase family protein [Geomonas oryzae]|nr:DEAD/DEAH box helicase family protein [Geomonas oryzae]
MSAIMNSTNFEMLRGKCPELAELGGFAEQYAIPDPSSALVKLRAYVESMVSRIYTAYGIPRPWQPSLNDLLNNHAFSSLIPPVVLDKFHAIRVHGNKAAHGESQNSQKALWLLKEAYDLGCWFFVTQCDGSADNCPAYLETTASTHDGGVEWNSKPERKAILEKLAAQEARMQELLQELEVQREALQVAAKKPADQVVLKKSGQLAADALAFDEETTRLRLIDSMLVDAGWQVGAKGGSTEFVVQEHDVQWQPTTTGNGRADYVLKDDNGKPLAVVEAKKTAKDPNIGRKQAQLYADGLEKEYGQRPIIFYTNGFDLWMWDDAQKSPPRKVYGFYSKDSLQYLVNFQRTSRKPLDEVTPNPDIAGRLYQLEAIKRVSERFTAGYRKTLVVQATGTGKTRIAISITDLLIRANWVKRVLFLCDRKELRKQAKNAFNDFINEPMAIVGARTAKDRNQRIYLSTYPAMAKIFQTFDVGFFDLIIADESHRSIYNRYRDIFQYFDCFQVGLTATPVDFISRNTFRLFNCEEQDPTAYYPLERGIEEGYLVPYEVFTHTTNFLRTGVKYAQLTDEQKQQLEEDGEDPETFNYESTGVDKQIFNKETNRAILRNLMENGIREPSGQHVGKSIIFARSHQHAVLLSQLFDEMYPQYGGNFCQVIDNYDPRAEQLIDDFKGLGSNKELTIAISVDMLDTGIDVPEIVNLTFAKPVKSKVKFWQMIGRGTRLCKNLFGAGKDKAVFRIFDHWGNFEYFDQNRPEVEPTAGKSLMQRLFEARIGLAETALNKPELAIFSQAAELIGKDLASLPEQTIAVRERWKEKRSVSRPEILTQFAPATVRVLRDDMAPLMQWVYIQDHTDAYDFDLLVTTMQTALLKNSGRFDDFKGQLIGWVSQLLMHLNPVRARAETIARVRDPKFWESVTVLSLEEIRRELRGIMHHSLKGGGDPGVGPRVIDVSDGEIEFSQRTTNVKEVDMVAYRRRVEETLRELFDTNATLKKIRAGQPVSENDLTALVSLVLTHNPGVNLAVLKEFYADTAAPLDVIIRSIIGMDAELVKRHFTGFVQSYPKLSANQILFLNMLQNHISKYGSVDLDRLYEPPFTSINSDGLDGVFTDDRQIDDLLAIIQTFNPHHYRESSVV